MGRPRKPSRRYHITLGLADAALLDAYAAEQSKPSTTVAARLLTQTLRMPNPAPVPSPAMPSSGRGPRWEWTMAELLADRRWWTSWLPRLNELMGRPLAGYASRSPVLDRRGYVDLLNSLFPRVERDGRVLAEWHASDYPDHARHAGEATRSAVWEPVLRHVAEALCALEQTGITGADPYLRIRAKEELAGSWLRTLRRLVGDEMADFPASAP